MSVLSLSNVGVSIGGAQLLKDVHATVHAGEFIALLGPNGAGKSTLLRAVLGLIPHTGTIQLGLGKVQPRDPRMRARLAAYVPQRSALTSALTVHEVVSQGRFAHESDTEADTTAINAALSACDLDELQDRFFPDLSGGEQQRVLLARAFATEAPLLCLDEALAHLDLAHALHILALLRARAEQGHAIILAIHDLELAQRHCDRALVLDHGRLVADDAMSTVLNDERLAQVFALQRRNGHLVRVTD